MSRSYKKYPIVKQDRENYHYQNRQIRHDKLAKIPKGGSYRKKNSFWISKYRWSKEQAIHDYYEIDVIRERFPTIELWLDHWKSCCVRK